eukprot:12234673-Alexandrium_andersonii.AAC.1
MQQPFTGLPCMFARRFWINRRLARLYCFQSACRPQYPPVIEQCKASKYFYYESRACLVRRIPLATRGCEHPGLGHQ